MGFSQNCGSPVEGRFCAKCGAPTGADPGTQPNSTAVPPSIPTSAGLPDNLAAALCYIPIVGGIFLFLDPYSRNRLIRFHAIQSLLLVGVMWVAMIALASVS